VKLTREEEARAKLAEEYKVKQTEEEEAKAKLDE
jgi:hypothetical protein